MSDTGKLQVSLIATDDMMPVEGATVEIMNSDDTDQVVMALQTDSSGQTESVSLNAPPLEYSEEPDNPKPYAEYTVRVTAPGFETIYVSGIEVLPDVTALQPVQMHRHSEGEQETESVEIPAHTLFGEYPAKIPEAEIKPVDETGEIVLSKVVIPEYIIVHDGVPTDKTARNYYVRYKDYIKNVVSSEIYATWPESTLYANALAIISFTLNRVYTEWYRNKGYDFTITSSTAYDQKWVYGRNIYSNINYLVDSIFANYLSKPGVKQPIFTSYCDGRYVTCKGLSQWGSKYLGEQGYSAINILRYYYGNDMYINTTTSISGIPSSFPGYNLSIGSSGEKVKTIQSQLNRIARNFPAIPKIAADGFFGNQTKKAVQSFQKIFGIPANGIVDYPTWYEISSVYVGVTRIAEPG